MKKHKATLEKGLLATNAIPMWSRIILETLEPVKRLLPPGSNVIEIGYGDGKLSCFLADEYGWRITGYEISHEAQKKAIDYARKVGVDDITDFNVVKPEETWKLEGEYDAVFIKTVLYNAKTTKEYGKWLDWVCSVMKPSGIFINFENGKTNLLTQVYRRIRKRYYTDLCMYDSEIHLLYERRFKILHVAHYGSISQFIAPFRIPYLIISTLEELFFTRNAGNSFITALVTKKLDGRRQGV